jgi:hypothetical protein
LRGFLSGFGGESLLHTQSAPNGLYGARKLHQETVSGGLEDAPVMRSDLRFKDPMTEPLDSDECTVLVLAHEA